MSTSTDSGVVMEPYAEGFALRVLGVPTGATLHDIANAQFNDIYPDRSLYKLEKGPGGEVYALLEYDWVMDMLHQRRVMIEHAGAFHRLGFVRVSRTAIRGSRPPCIFRRKN